MIAPSTLAIALTACLTASMETADSASDPDSKGSAKTVAVRIWNGGKQLHTGRYRGTETIRSHVADDSIVESVTTFEGAFDVAAGRYRYARTRPAEAGPVVTIFIETPAAVALYTSSTSRMSIVAPEDFKRSPYDFVDVRLLGIATGPELATRTFGEMETYIASLPVIISRPDKSGDNVLATFAEFGGEVQRAIQCDESKDGVPHHMEMRYRPAGEDDWSEPHDVCDVVWERRGGTWVPVEAALARPQVARPERREISIEWLEVNSNVDPALFDWQAVELPAGTKVVDSRLDPESPILVKRIGAPLVPVPATTRSNSQRQNVRRLAMWLSGGILGILMLLVLVRHRRSRIAAAGARRPRTHR